MSKESCVFPVLWINRCLAIPMNKILQTTRLFFPVFIVAFKMSCFGGPFLPDGWWLQNSPEQVLVKAQSINEQFLFFHGEKLGNTASELTNPFAKKNQTNHTDFIQRRNTDGLIETKTSHLHGDFKQTEFKLRSGNYHLIYGQLIKQEFAEGDEAEKLIAAKIDYPYEFKVGASEMVFTNECIVVVRTMSAPLLKAAADLWYAKYSAEEKNEFAPRYIRSEVDYYFRKSDGVSLGVIKRNRAGELLENKIYDKIELDQPIANEQFSLPKVEIKVAKTSEESMKISNDLLRANRSKTKKNPKPADSEKRGLELPWTTDLATGLRRAKAENKILLLDFTGSDWCVWCMKFEEDILFEPEFVNYAKTNLIMLMLDFPHDKMQSDAEKKTNAELQKKYKAESFPTYVLLNSFGKEVGRQTGYLKGGPKVFIDKLEGFKKQ